MMGKLEALNSKIVCSHSIRTIYNILRAKREVTLLLTFTFLLFTLLAFYFLHTTYYIPPTTFAAGSECQVDASVNARASGLISIGADSALTGTFGNPSGICAFDPKAAFISFKLPTYAELKSKHFDQIKTSKVTFNSPLPAIADQTVYYTAGDLSISSNPAGSGTAVIFIDGNLDIASGITYGTETTGLVFIVKGNVNISPAVQILNAVIIAQGQIFTGSAGCTKNSEIASLTIKGSLISLDSTKKIIFCRTLSDNSTPAEVINQQSKYVVILRDLFSGTLQKWTEVAGVPYIATQLPTPTPTSAPTPTQPPSCIPSTSDFLVSAFADDGYVKREGPDWPPDGAITVATIGDNVYIYPAHTFAYDSNDNLLYVVSNGLARFDTSSLPDNAIITSASFIAVVVGKGDGTTDRFLTADWYTGPIDADAWTATAVNNAISGSGVDISVIVVSTNPITIPLIGFATNVSKTDYTGLRFHISGGQSTGDYVLFNPVDSPNNVTLRVSYTCP